MSTSPYPAHTPPDLGPAGTTAMPAPTTAAAPTATGGRHRVDVGHLVMGLAFLCFTGAWALVQGDVVDGGDVSWLLPVPWLVGGAAGLAVIAARSLRRDRSSRAHPIDRTDTETDTDTEELR